MERDMEFEDVLAGATDADFSRNKLTISQISRLINILKHNSTLGSLNLKKSSISDETAFALAAALTVNTALLSLNLERNFIGENEAPALAKALEENCTLSSLSLERNPVCDNGALAFGKMLQQNCTLVSLNLKCASIGENGTEALSKGLERNSSLLTLNLEDNYIGKNGASALAKALKENSALLSLNLNWNKIGIDGAVVFGEALKHNHTLTTLCLKSNCIGDGGVLGLCTALKRNHKLELLNLENNSISESGALALGEALHENYTLEYLNLEDNYIGVDGAAALSKALERNDTLKNLNLKKNPIYDAEAFDHILKHNKTLIELRTDIRMPFFSAPSTRNRALLKEKQEHERTSLTGVMRLAEGTANEREKYEKRAQSLTVEVLAQWIGFVNTDSLKRFLELEKEYLQIEQLINHFNESASVLRTDNSIHNHDEAVLLRNQQRHELLGLLRTFLAKNLDECVNGVQSFAGALNNQSHPTGKIYQPCSMTQFTIQVERVTAKVKLAYTTITDISEMKRAKALYKKTEDAIAALETSGEDLGVENRVGAFLLRPRQFDKLQYEIANVFDKLSEELNFLKSDFHSFNVANARLRLATAAVVECRQIYIPNAISKLLEVRKAFADLLGVLSEGEYAPDISMLGALLTEQKSNRRMLKRLQLELQLAREDYEEEKTKETHKRLKDLESKISSIEPYALDRSIRKERARLIRLAQDHFPELLQSREWCKSVGVSDLAFLEASALGIWLSESVMGSMTTVKTLSENVGRHVLLVQDNDGSKKVLKKFSLASFAMSGKFGRQATAFARISSAHVVQPFGIFTTASQGFSFGCILMPFYPRGTLKQLLDENVHVTDTIRKRIAIGILTGLHDIHKTGQVHCDIKPSNIFLTNSLSPIIGDFDGTQDTSRTITIGLQLTTAYMAPELRAGDISRALPSLDMYSFGVLLEELFPTPDAFMADLQQSLKAQDPDQRISALDALSHRAFDIQTVSLASCMICLDNYPALHGAVCGSGHFVCQDCLAASVSAASDPEGFVRVTRDGAMPCMANNCNSIFPGSTIARHIPEEIFARLIRVVKGHIENDADIRAEREIQHRVQEFIKLDGLNREAVVHMKHIQDHLLCTCCPRCKTVFTDFDGCCALKCRSCDCYFCAWCLCDTGNTSDACHRHVANCEKNGSRDHDPFFPESFSAVQSAWLALRAERLQAYWQNDIRDDLKEILHERLASLLSPDVVGPEFNL